MFRLPVFSKEKVHRFHFFISFHFISFLAKRFLIENRASESAVGRKFIEDQQLKMAGRLVVKLAVKI